MPLAYYETVSSRWLTSSEKALRAVAFGLFLFAAHGSAVGQSAGAAGKVGENGEAGIRLVKALEETFDSNARAWPYVETTESHIAAIESGRLLWKNVSQGDLQAQTLELPVSANRAHEFSVELRLSGEKGGAGFLINGASDFGSYNYVLLDHDGHWRVGNWNGLGLYDVGRGDETAIYLPDAFNRIALRVFEDQWAFFLNGVCLWVGPRGAKGGNLNGFLIRPGGEVEFDNFTIHYLRADQAILQSQFAAYAAAVGDSSKRFLSGPTKEQKLLESPTDYVEDPVGPLVSAEMLQQWLQSGFQLQQAGKYAEGATEFRRIIRSDPRNVMAHVQLAWCWLNLGELPAAQVEAKTAWGLDRADLAACALLAYTHAARSEWGEAEARLRDAFLLDWSRSAAPFLFKDADDLIGRGKGADFAIRLKSLMQTIQQNAPDALQQIVGTSLPIDALRARVSFQLANQYLNAGNAKAAGELVDVALSRLAGRDASAIRAQAELLDVRARSANVLGDIGTLRSCAEKLSLISGTGDDDLHRAMGFNLLGLSYLGSSLPAERETAKRLFERARDLVERRVPSALQVDVMSNLALSCWQNGEKGRARVVYQDLVDRTIARKSWLQAETILNNLASLDFQEGDFGNAAISFRRAIALTEQARLELKGEQRIHFLEARLSAYQFLVACLQGLGDLSALFEAENSLRARVLAETLNQGKPPEQMDLKRFQGTLAVDEAAIFYTLLNGGEVVANVVTRERSVAVRHDEFESLVAFKKKYLDRANLDRKGYKPVAAQQSMNGLWYADRDAVNYVSMSDFEGLVETMRSVIEEPDALPPEFRQAYLRQTGELLHKLLMAPLAPYLAGKKKLILFPDGILYFVPFEVLRDSDGRYVVERFDVRYCQSAAVWQGLSERPDAGGSRPFLGFGGAEFSAMGEESDPPYDVARMMELQMQALGNAASGSSQREVFAALFGNAPMSYLAGSLTEVLNLTEIVSASVSGEPLIYTGPEMTERRIKELSRSGELKDFRVVHFATHGFALPEVPLLSGIAMTIFPTARDGEDGYLTAPEIARLGFRADLVVLSACQTGLGRIYGGEGVLGLTGALLEGGANRALVSLWPVSDAGTMQFMTEVYSLHFIEKVPWDEAVNRVKRSFVSGEYGPDFQDINIWAPFVQYGR